MSPEPSVLRRGDAAIRQRNPGALGRDRRSGSTDPRSEQGVRPPLGPDVERAMGRARPAGSVTITRGTYYRPGSSLRKNSLAARALRRLCARMSSAFHAGPLRAIDSAPCRGCGGTPRRDATCRPALACAVSGCWRTAGRSAGPTRGCSRMTPPRRGRPGWSRRRAG